MEKEKQPFIKTWEILKQKHKDGTLGEILQDWKWIISYGRGYEFRIFIYTMTGILSTTFGLISAVANKYVIDIVVGRKMDRLWLAILITVGSALLGLVLSNAVGRFSYKLSVDIHKDVKQDVYGKILKAEWLETNRYSNGDLLNRFNHDIETVGSNAISWLPSIIIACYNFLATFFVIWYYNKTMALIALSSAPILALSSKYLISKQRYYGKKQKEYRSRIVSNESETFYNLDTIKSFGLGESFERKFRELLDGYKELALESNMFKIMSGVFLALISMAVSFAAFGYALWLLWTDAITYGTMVLFLQQRSSLTSAFKSVVGIIPSFVGSSVSAHRIRELAELPKEQPGEMVAGVFAHRGGLTVTMEDVSFSYGGDETVIENSEFIARPGEIVALVGNSGEGKTTAFRLLLGIVTPQKGFCGLTAADGQKIHVSVDSRQLFSYVPQGNSLLSGTIAENLRIVNECASDEDMIEALKTACAWDFVEKLPGGLEYHVGEKGKGLSEGQAQRVSIARALLRDAPVLLLDEATSALDVQTERQVLRNILNKSPDHTFIITTHRPTVLSMCDRTYRVVKKKIIQLDQGQINEIVRSF